MKKIATFLLLALSCLLPAADETAETAYRKLLLSDPAYAKQAKIVDGLQAKRDALGETLFPGYAEIIKHVEVSREGLEKSRAMMKVIYQSPEFRKSALACTVPALELSLLENQICAKVDSPEMLAVLKKEYLKKLPQFSNAAAAPKKEIAGSSAFQHAMYVIDKAKETDAANQKWPTHHAGVWLMLNLKQDAFDDADYRRIYYQTQSSQLAVMKKYREIELAHPELADKLMASSADRQDSPENRQTFQKYFAEMQEIANADPEHRKLMDAARKATQAETALLVKFAETSKVQSAVEYLAFKAALKALEK